MSLDNKIVEIIAERLHYETINSTIRQFGSLEALFEGHSDEENTKSILNSRYEALSDSTKESMAAAINSIYYLIVEKYTPINYAVNEVLTPDKPALAIDHPFVDAYVIAFRAGGIEINNFGNVVSA